MKQINNNKKNPTKSTVITVTADKQNQHEILDKFWIKPKRKITMICSMREICKEQEQKPI